LFDGGCDGVGGGGVGGEGLGVEGWCRAGEGGAEVVNEFPGGGGGGGIGGGGGEGDGDGSIGEVGDGDGEGVVVSEKITNKSIVSSFCGIGRVVNDGGAGAGAELG